MTHRHFGMTGSARAVLAFALAAGLAAPGLAQQADTPAPAPARPIDFRLPPAPENDGRTPGVQGPSNNGIAPTGPNETRPTPTPTPAPPRVTPTQPQPQPSAPTAARPAATAPAARDTAAASAPRVAAPTAEAASADALPTSTDAAPTPSLPSATTASAPPVDDTPARDTAAVPASDSEVPIWTWLLALLAAAGAGAWYWRRRPVVADGLPAEPAQPAAPQPRPVPAPQPAPRAAMPPPASRPQPAPAPVRQPMLEGTVAAGQRAPSSLVTRPAAERRALVSIALEVLAIRMTPEHVVVGFALNLANQGSADATGLMVRIALNQGSAMPEPVLARFFDGAGGSVLRDDMEMKVGAGESLTTEAMLPRAIVEPLMIGGKPMLVPVMAFDVTYHWEGDDPDAFGQIAGSFVLGREQGTSGSEKLAPLPLDRASYAVDRPGSRATAVRRSQ